MLIIKRIYLSALTAVLLMSTEIKCDHVPSVIIIGAGSAGIAAASKLYENNITNITVLEAEGRIGGRIHTVKFGETLVDLGAQFCYGKKDNIVYELVKDLNLLVPEKLKMTLYHSSYDYENETQQDEEFYDLYYTIYEEGKKGNEEVSLGEYMMGRLVVHRVVNFSLLIIGISELVRYNDTVKPRYQNDPQKLKLSLEFMHFFLKHLSSYEGGFSAFDESVKSDFKEDEDLDIFSWKGLGFSSILEILMKMYPHPENPIQGNILLNKEVVEIVWDNSSEYHQGVAVKCLDDSTYIADHVIFTPSLGVLKEQHKMLFHPPLPINKVNAIEDLGVGAFVKVFLQFPTRWWPSTNFTDFTFVWADKDVQLLEKEFPHGPHVNNKSWLLDLLTVSYLEESTNILVALFHGESVPKIEICSDTLITEGIMFVLNKFVGRHFDDITEPGAILRHNWYSSRHFRGTDSYQTVKARSREVSAEIRLAQPLRSSSGKHTLLFAGEATHPIYYSTVPGAIETGYREAQRIINFYK